MGRTMIKHVCRCKKTFNLIYMLQCIISNFIIAHLPSGGRYWFRLRLSVCLFVCLFVCVSICYQNISRTNGYISISFYRKCPLYEKELIKFWSRSNSRWPTEMQQVYKTTSWAITLDRIEILT